MTAATFWLGADADAAALPARDLTTMEAALYRHTFWLGADGGRLASLARPARHDHQRGGDLSAGVCRGPCSGAAGSPAERCARLGGFRQRGCHASGPAAQRPAGADCGLSLEYPPLTRRGDR